MLDRVQAFKSSSHGLVQVLLYISAPSCNNHIWKGNVLFNDALNTFYFTVIWRR